QRRDGEALLLRRRAAQRGWADLVAPRRRGLRRRTGPRTRHRPRPGPGRTAVTPRRRRWRHLEVPWRRRELVLRLVGLVRVRSGLVDPGVTAGPLVSLSAH